GDDAVRGLVAGGGGAPGRTVPDARAAVRPGQPAGPRGTPGPCCSPAADQPGARWARRAPARRDEGPPSTNDAVRAADGAADDPARDPRDDLPHLRAGPLPGAERG